VVAALAPAVGPVPVSMPVGFPVAVRPVLREPAIAMVAAVPGALKYLHS